jgi:hypothetical protein
VPQHVGDCSDNFDEARVTLRVGELVIHLLEMIEVDEYYRNAHISLQSR